MADTIIENPILNSPFREPDRHWLFTDEGITNEIVETRRASAYFVPIPPPKKKGKQLQFDTEWTQDRGVLGVRPISGGPRGQTDLEFFPRGPRGQTDLRCSGSEQFRICSKMLRGVKPCFPVHGRPYAC